MPVKQLRPDQQADPCLREIIAQLETGNKVSPNFRKQLPDIPLLIRQFSLLELHNQILYRTQQVGGCVTWHIVLPEQFRDAVLQSLHDDMGRLCIVRTINLGENKILLVKQMLRERF